MAKLRVSRTVFQYKIDKFIKEGRNLISSKTVNGDRVVEFDTVRMTHTKNGWMLIEPK